MFKEIENKFDNCIYLYSKVNKNRCSPVNSGDWSLSNLMWVHASQPHEWFLLCLRQKELMRWLAYKCHICFREESFRRWRMKHGANRLNVRALRINHDTIIDIYFWAQELSNGFVGAAEASNLLPVATNFGFRIKCLCVLISLTFHSCLQLFVFLLGRNNLHRIRPVLAPQLWLVVCNRIWLRFVNIAIKACVYYWAFGHWLIKNGGDCS